MVYIFHSVINSSISNTMETMFHSFMRSQYISFEMTPTVPPECVMLACVVIKFWVCLRHWVASRGRRETDTGAPHSNTIWSHRDVQRTLIVLLSQKGLASWFFTKLQCGGELHRSAASLHFRPVFVCVCESDWVSECVCVRVRRDTHRTPVLLRLDTNLIPLRPTQSAQTMCFVFVKLCILWFLYQCKQKGKKR